jgi:two-component system, OmpR family, phosphate regulon sensor histidine kinase PhoR
MEPTEINVATRIFVKMVLAILAVLAVGMVAVEFLVSGLAESSYVETRTRDLAEKVDILLASSAVDLQSLSEARVHELAGASAARLTIIASDGRVAFDSEAQAARMENHRGRPEFQRALQGQLGVSIRHSPTLGVNFLYVAKPMPGGALRLAVPLADIERQVSALRRRLLTASLLALIPAVILAAIFARAAARSLARIIDQAGELARGNFQVRVTPGGGKELSLLSEKLNETGERLQRVIGQLEREQKNLERLERIRKDFVINVSHELRTPLASIQGYTETLLDGALHDQENNARFLGIIQQNATRLGRLIADIMTLSRIELKTQKFQFASYPVAHLLDEALDTMRPAAEKKEIRLVLEPPPQGAEVFCDSEATHQILANLLDNAIKYTPEGGTVTASAIAESDTVRFLVRDTGIGVPKEELSRLFERFYRVDKARSRELGGTGLGLAIVKHLVLAQGGDVSVNSELGQGSVFSFTLPVHDLGLAENPPLQAQLTGL